MAVSDIARQAFSRNCEEIYRAVSDALGDKEELGQAINKFPQAVFIKNESELLVVTNEVFARIFSGDHVTGRHARTFLDESFLRVSKCTDELILSGTDRVDCVHTGAMADGHIYVVQIHKRSLVPQRRPGYTILGIVQPEERVDSEAQRIELTRVINTFRQMDQRDQELCRLVALGKSSAEIGKSLQMTGRNVEIRRKKVFTDLGIEKPVDLARLLVRLQERGHLDLGL